MKTIVDYINDRLLSHTKIYLNESRGIFDLKITDEDNQEYKPYSDYKSEEFERIMEDSAKTRMFIHEAP